MTPLQITTLLAIHCYPDQKVRCSAIHSLHRDGLIDPKPGVRLCDDGAISYDIREYCPPLTAQAFILTSRGSAMVQALLELPLPQAEISVETMWHIPGTDFEFAESEL